MSELRLQIGWDEHWNKEIEHIQLPATPGVHEITETLDWWQPDGRFYVYRTRGEAKVRNDGRIDAKIEYHAEDNEEDVQDSVWGTLILSMQAEDYTGRCRYEPIDDEPFEREWRRIADVLPRDLRQKRIHKRHNQISRDARFRLAVLAEDRQCVITGEKMAAVLDAAHIIPAADAGADVIQNALTLRTDIHRLFDNEFFYIDPNGSIQINPSKWAVSRYYKNLLQGAKIDARAFERVRPALAELGS
ncbi:HNH endonuclease [Ectothiorhodospiraceae bacterium WFHF3C12]|nr:HNH endonuclease [Ectothiorhodospiraceae bacterium WFHF3C12]